MHDTWKDMFVMGLPLAEKILRPIIVHKDRKSTRLNSSHTVISYAVFCLKKKKHRTPFQRHSAMVCRACITNGTRTTACNTSFSCSIYYWTKLRIYTRCS